MLTAVNYNFTPKKNSIKRTTIIQLFSSNVVENRKRLNDAFAIIMYRRFWLWSCTTAVGFNYTEIINGCWVETTN